MSYFGYVRSKKGRFALVGHNGKNIVLRRNDVLYEKDVAFTVREIRSNAIVLSDRYGRRQTVYFSSGGGR